MADDLRAFLVRAVLDDTFRDLARRDPHAALRGYALSEADAQALTTSGDLLTLLAKALGQPAVPPSEPADAAPAPAPPPARVVLQVSPQVQSDADGGARLVHAVSMHAYPHSSTGAASFLVSLHPVSQGQTLVYTAAIEPLDIPRHVPADNPWMADLASPQVDEAVAAVHAATRADRYARLLDLVAQVAR